MPKDSNGKRIRPDLVKMNKDRATHKLSNHITYSTWRSMRARCYNPKTASYRHYGGRGIKVCDRWLENFENFLEDMGKKPKGMQLDRVDNNGDYCKENCRWVTPEKNANNRRTNRYFYYKGERLTIAEMARINGISRQGMRYRINSGYSIERAITKEDKYVKGDKG